MGLFAGFKPTRKVSAAEEVLSEAQIRGLIAEFSGQQQWTPPSPPPAAPFEALPETGVTADGQ
jgi:hypothetical protein